MAWEITADPKRFDEAIDWFSKRTVITGEEATRIDADSRERSFWVGGGLQLTQVQRVFDQLQKAIETAEPLDAFKKRMQALLKDPAHAETVFRNATQRAYNAGRYWQLRDVEEWRPYWMFDAIMDGRTTVICKRCKKTILLASDPWWQSHWPPLHHRCRSTVRSLGRREAERLGISAVPLLPATPGWGRTPDNDTVWKPDPKAHDPALITELKRKEKKPRTRKPKARPEHQPAHWSKEYEHLGDAGAAAAYGRAMAERSLDRTPAQLRVELLRLKAAQHPSLDSLSFYELSQLPQNKPVRGTAFAEQNRGLLAISEHTRSITPGDPLEFVGTEPKAITRAKVFYALTLDKAVSRPEGWSVGIDPLRRGFAKGGRTKEVAVASEYAFGNGIHEVAHAIEDTDSRALNRSLAFLEARTKGEKLRRLKGYPAHELSRKDKFVDAYIGKDYKKHGTEVTSMGYQLMVSHGIKDSNLEHLAREDPEMLYFLLGQLAGK